MNVRGPLVCPNNWPWWSPVPGGSARLQWTADNYATIIVGVLLAGELPGHSGVSHLRQHHQHQVLSHRGILAPREGLWLWWQLCQSSDSPLSHLDLLLSLAKNVLCGVWRAKVWASAAPVQERRSTDDTSGEINACYPGNQSTTTTTTTTTQDHLTTSHHPHSGPYWPPPDLPGPSRRLTGWLELVGRTRTLLLWEWLLSQAAHSEVGQRQPAQSQLTRELNIMLSLSALTMWTLTTSPHQYNAMKPLMPNTAMFKTQTCEPRALTFL